jgi:hypothetical protein
MTLSFSNDDNGNAPLYYVAITLSSNAGSGFQQLINWDPSTYSTYLNTDCQNHSWQDGAGNLLDSWFETPSATSSSTSVYEWVVLPNSTATKIYLVFSATTASGYSTTHTGVQPNYSTTYGQYDNGASVFSFYDNFAGTTLSSKWTVVNSGQTVNNGMSQGTTAPSIYSTSYTLNPQNTVTEAYAYVNTPLASNANDGFISVTIISNSHHTYNSGGYYLCDYNGTAGTDTALDTAASNSSPSVWSVWYSAAATGSAMVNYGTPVTLTTDIPTITAGAVQLSVHNGAATAGTQYFTWVRTRANPPSSTMPTTTFGSATKVPSGYSQLLMAM